MTQYWPNAIVLKKNDCQLPQALWTMDGYVSQEQAWEVIRLWSKEFRLLSAWVKDSQNNICGHECYVDSFGGVTYKGSRIDIDD